MAGSGLAVHYSAGIDGLCIIAKYLPAAVPDAVAAFWASKPQFVFELDNVLRKSGHFIGYAVLSGLTFLALRNTYRDRINASSQRPWGQSLGDFGN